MTSVTVVRRPARFVAYATGGFGLAVNSMVQFLLPLRATELGIDIATIGLLLGAKGLTEAATSVPVGGLIDRIGTQRAFLLGTSMSALLGIGYATVDTWTALLALQLALGLVRPLGWIGSQALASGLRGGADKAKDTGRFSFVATAAQIVAPLVVGVATQTLGTSGGFATFSMYCGAFTLLGLAAPGIRGTGRGATPNRPKQGVAASIGMLRVPGIRVAMLLTFTRLWIPSAWTAFFPLYLVTSGSSESAAATVVSAMGLIATVVSAFVGRLAKLGRDAVVTAIALAAGCAGLALAPMVGSVPPAYVSAALVGIGQGVSLPMLIVLVSNAVPESQRAMALGLRSSVNQLAAAVAPSVVATILAVSVATVGFAVAGGVGLCFLAAAMTTERRHQPA